MEKESKFDDLQYQHGFGNQFASEAKEGAIPTSKIYLIQIKIALLQ